MIAKTTSSVTTVRCPACGQRLDPPDATRCPLCKQALAADDLRVTGEDVTPYAKSYAAGERGWRGMCKWVWLAGSERLKHLALIRASDASRRFALNSCLFFALGLVCFQGTRIGWNRVAKAPDSQTAARPTGQGWVRVVPSSAGNAVELWWNPAQAVIGGVLGGLAGLAVMAVARAMAAKGVDLAHRSAFRGEQRMTAALHYSSAWGVPALAAALFCLARPLALAGEAAKASWLPPEAGILTLGGVLAALSATGWWIWLVRLGATAPTATRGRVAAYFLVGAPFLAVAAGTGWWYGLEWINPRLFVRLNLQF